MFTAGDLGGQGGLLMSPQVISEFIVPYHRELNDLIHSYGAKVMYHSCGSVIRAVESPIGAGVDVLDAILYRRHDAGGLKDQFGDRLCFHGGVSVQKTLVDAAPGDVALEVAHLSRVLGKNGGYILAPSHFIQAGTPPENLIAVLRSANRMEALIP